MTDVVPGQVWVVVVSHKHGTDISVHRTPEGAEKDLADYCKEWWNNRGWIEEECPEDEKERVQRYFEIYEDEYYEICSRIIEP